MISAQPSNLKRFQLQETIKNTEPWFRNVVENDSDDDNDKDDDSTDSDSEADDSF